MIVLPAKDKKTTCKYNTKTIHNNSSNSNFKKLVCLFVTEETLYIIECGQTMAHYCTHLCQKGTIIYSITADSRQGS